MVDIIMHKMSNRYLKMAEVYLIFSKEWKHCLDFSDDAKYAMYAFETHGTTIKEPNANGFFIGKKWLDVAVTMWKEDIRNKLLIKQELYESGDFPTWWLDKVLKDI